MGLSCGAQCAKFILFAFNIVFWLSGVGLIGAGTFVAVSDDLNVMDDFLESGDSQLKYIAYGLIGIGVFVFIVGFCGCCGAIKESQCLLGSYIALLVIVLILELAVGIFAVVNKNKMEQLITDKAMKSLKEFYPSANSTTKDGINYKKSLDMLQMKGECCGIESFKDWESSKWYTDTAIVPKPKVPPSCCKSKVNDYGSAYTKCIKNAEFYRKSCSTYIAEVMKKNAPIVIGVGCGIAALEIFGLIFAICLCRSIGNSDYDA